MARTRCPLRYHFAAGTNRCIGCGKLRPDSSTNPRKKLPPSIPYAERFPRTFHGYTIGKTLAGDIFIEKDGVLISWAKTGAQAESVIKSLGPMKNPRSAKRIGRAVELRYLRDQGQHRGLYKHSFRRRAAGVWTEPDKTVAIR